MGSFDPNLVPTMAVTSAAMAIAVNPRSRSAAVRVIWATVRIGGRTVAPAVGRTSLVIARIAGKSAVAATRRAAPLLKISGKGLARAARSPAARLAGRGALRFFGPSILLGAIVGGVQGAFRARAAGVSRTASVVGGAISGATLGLISAPAATQFARSAGSFFDPVRPSKGGGIGTALGF